MEFSRRTKILKNVVLKRIRGMFYRKDLNIKHVEDANVAILYKLLHLEILSFFYKKNLDHRPISGVYLLTC
jgi:hypothetical protein